MIAHQVRFGFSTFGLRKKVKGPVFSFFCEIAPNKKELRIERLGTWTATQYFKIHRCYALV